MNFFRNFSTETNVAIFVAGVFLFFVTSSAVSIVRAEPNEVENSSEYIWDQSLSVYTPLPDGSASDETCAPSEPDADRPGYESPGADGPKENPPVETNGWWTVVCEFFDSMLAALSF